MSKDTIYIVLEASWRKCCYDLKNLSQRRAESAVSYILSKGIDDNRITARGYGESQLIILNAETEDEAKKLAEDEAYSHHHGEVIMGVEIIDIDTLEE